MKTSKVATTQSSRFATHVRSRGLAEISEGSMCRESVGQGKHISWRCSTLLHASLLVMRTVHRYEFSGDS